MIHPSPTGLTPVEDALIFLHTQIQPLTCVETVPLSEALQRILAVPVVADFDSPPWDNSAMDGYALHDSDIPDSGGTLPIGGRITAGCSAVPTCRQHTTVRIFTGAQIPPRANTVVPQEHCRVEGDRVHFQPVKAGQNIRFRGEEYRKDTPLLAAGHYLRPQDIGLLASQGQQAIPVWRRLRIGVFSSGNELATPADLRTDGQIFDSNGPMLHACLQKSGFVTVNLGRIPDQLDATVSLLDQAASSCDLLLSSGGVSVGEEDYLRQAVAQLGTVELWRLAIQPGKPLAFGQIRQTPWFGVPGNPVAAMVTFLTVVLPCLWQRQGRKNYQLHPSFQPAGFDWPQAPTRRMYLRCQLRQCTDTSPKKHQKNTIQNNVNKQMLYPLEQQNSAMLTSLTHSDGFAVIDIGQTVSNGDTLPFIHYSAFWD